MIIRFALVGCLAGVVSCTTATPVAPPVVARPPPPPMGAALRTAEELAEIPDGKARSVALFTEASKVLLHPRCVNCHPAANSPLQGNPGKVHSPPVERGVEGRGAVAMGCATCHQDRNIEDARLPGAPNWHLAPSPMVLQGRTASQVCAQMKDPHRNGNRSLAQIVAHSRDDKLVAWGWAPGADREPAPGSQEVFGALMAAWVETGAVCPP